MAVIVVGGGGGVPVTSRVAEAVPPAPPSVDVTAPVVLFFVPDVVAVTLTLRVQDVLAASVAPLKVIELDPGAAVSVPSQLPLKSFGFVTTRPDGSGSLKATPLKLAEPLGLRRVKFSRVEPLTAMLPLSNDLAIVGGSVAAALTITLADAVPPVPPSFELTAPVVLFFVPAVVALTFTLKVHEALAARVPPDNVMLLEPAVAVIVPTPQLPVRPFGVATTSPDGSGSVKPTPVSEDALVLPSVKVSEVDPLTGMLTLPKALAMLGGTAPLPLVVIRATRGPANSVNHNAPSGPEAMSNGKEEGEIPDVNSVTVPVGVIRPILFPVWSVNHRLPSAPAAMPKRNDGVAIPLLNSVTVPVVVIRPILPVASTNQRLPSGPAVMPLRVAPALIPLLNSVTVPVGVIRPIATRLPSVNHRFPSGPAVIRNGCAPTMPVGNSVTVPVGVIRPIKPVLSSVNHKLPSGPAVMPNGFEPSVMPVLNSVTTPLGVMRPIEAVPFSVNHRLPSGPSVMTDGFAPGVIPALNSVTVPVGVIRPILFALNSANQRLPSGPLVMPSGPAFAVMPAPNSVTTCADAGLDSRHDKPRMQPSTMQQRFAIMSLAP